MFVPFLFILGYIGDYDHIFPFYKYLSMAKKYRWPMIAHERYFNDLEQMGSIGISQEQREHWCDFFRCDAPTQEDLNSVSQYKIPYLFEQDMLRQFSSRVDAWAFLLKNNYEPFEQLLGNMLDDILLRFEEPVEGIVAYFAPESLRRAASKRNIPLFFNEGGFIRPPVYNSFLMYMGNDYLQSDSKNAENRYKKFLQEISGISVVPILTRKELLSLFMAEEYQNDIALIEQPNQYEIGLLYDNVRSMFAVLHTHMGNEELSLDANKLYEPNQIITRGHPNHGMETDGSTPFQFICKCRRIAGVTGNMLLEAMLIGRIPCIYAKTQFSFMCNNGMHDPNVELVPLEFVNFLIFSNYIPIEWMANEEHLRFLASGPSETAKYMKTFTYFASKNTDIKTKYLPNI